jgi:23S rRNA (cytidine1920-2'-O)/16S rRNA (cytidine1409-2'-O)-methyltransferase
VRHGTERLDKPGKEFPADFELSVDQPPRFVSRGGEKLAAYLDRFPLDLTGQNVLDVGASTGGFTDCLLQHGAASVHAVDVGHGQLSWKLRQDPRVVALERTNARSLTPNQLGSSTSQFDIAVADCSFISLRLILPPIPGFLRIGGIIIALIKPQFEAGKEDVDRGAGVITDPQIHARVIACLESFVATDLPMLAWRGVTESPLRGPAGNKEFLAYLERIT